MKKTIVVVMAAASVVLSAQAMATDTVQVAALGEVSDASNSCVVTSMGTLNNGIVQLITVTTTEANTEVAGKLSKTQDFGFEARDCAQGSTNPAAGVTVNVSDTFSNDVTILDNTAANGAAGIDIGIQRVSDAHRVVFDDFDTTSESYSVTNGTQLKYTTGYIRTNVATPVIEGPVKGVATFTTDYTN